MARDWNKLATEVVELVGGEENISSITHCVTRLRFKLKDESIANDDAISALDGVIQVMHANGQYQVVIGQQVESAYDAVLALLPGKGDGSVPEDDDNANMSVKDKLMDIISGVFLPMIGAMSAAGLLKAVAITLSTFGVISQDSTTFTILNCMGDGVFQFLPLFLGYTAAKKFGATPFLGMAVGAFLCHPQMVGLQSNLDAAAAAAGTDPVTATLFGIPVILPAAGYLQSVVPVILACALLAPLEKFFKRVIPEVVRSIFAPLFSLFLTCTVTILVVGPVANTLSGWIAQGLLAILGVAPAIGGAAIAFAWPFLIIFGMHWAFIPVMMSNFGTLGYDFIMPLTVGTNFAVGAVLLAILLKTKKKDLKDTCIETLAPAWLAGVTEPGIYGVLLRFNRTFVIMALGCAVAGAIGGIANVHQTVMISASVLTLPALFGDMGIWQVVQAVAAAVVAFVLTYLFGYSDKMGEGAKAKDAAGEFKNDSSKAKPEAVQVAADKNVVCAPVSGTVEQADQIPDQAFASELMGKTVAVWPSDGNVYAPVSGTVVSMMPHAFGIAGDDGCEVLVHVGIDTVSMNGDGFTLWAKQGDHVSAGQPMLTFDRDKVAAAGYKDIVMTIVTNSDDYAGLSKSAEDTVSAGAQIMQTA